MRKLALILSAVMALLLPASAQTVPNIADLRADLDGLTAQLQSLRASLRVSGAIGYATAGGTTAIRQMDEMEAGLRKLTGEIEEARHQIETSLQSSADKLADLEFRLCQLEENCDLGDLLTPSQSGFSVAGEQSVSITLDMNDASDMPVVSVPMQNASEQERSDFEEAQALVQAGDHAAAARAFGRVARLHSGGPLFTEARFREGQELQATGDNRGASRAWTDVFAADPEGARAPEALFGVASILAQGDQTRPACLFFTEVTVRYPTHPLAEEATAELEALSCHEVGEADEPAL